MPNTPEIATIAVTILGRSFKVKCPDDKVEELQEAARYLETKMRNVNIENKFTTMDRVAVIAALNIAYEYLCLQSASESKIVSISGRILQISNKIEEVLVEAA
jgi:cell division protein ZapA